MKIQILDQDHHVLATGAVEAGAGSYSGTIHLQEMPAPMRQTFEEYEELVNSQALSVLDEYEDRIGAMRILVQFQDGLTLCPADLQLFPKGGTVFFRAAHARQEHVSPT